MLEAKTGTEWLNGRAIDKEVSIEHDVILSMGLQPSMS